MSKFSLVKWSVDYQCGVTDNKVQLDIFGAALRQITSPVLPLLPIWPIFAVHGALLRQFYGRSPRKNLTLHLLSVTPY